jgi:hypothetical protein
LGDKPFRIKEYSRDENIAYSHDVCNDMLFVVKGHMRGEMDEFFGVTRPSLARALAEMEAEQILRVERREITIRDKEKLNKLLNK